MTDFKPGTTYHICIFIEGALKRPDKELDGMLAENGKELNGKEVKAYLEKKRDEKGYTHYSGCSNMSAAGRCAGHPASEAAENSI